MFAFAAARTNKPCLTLTLIRKVLLLELYQMFGYADVVVLQKLVNSTTGLQLTNIDAFSYKVCMLNKSQKNILRCLLNQSSTFLHRVHVDIIGPIILPGLYSKQYWILYTNNYTRYWWINVVDCKAVIQGKFLQFLQKVETQHGTRIAIIYTDNDTVLINRETRRVCNKQGTVFKTSTPHTQHQNSTAEASNRVAASRARCMINSASHLPQKLWPLAAEYSIDLMNHTPTTSLPDGKTPKQLLLEHMKVVNTIPNLSTLRTFGEPGYVHTAEQRRHKGSKFEPRAEKHYFVGRQGSRIYLMWNPRTKRITRTSSVTWATHPLTEGSAYIDLPGPTQASDAKPPDGLYNTSTGSNPPSLLHPTPPGGSTHMGAPPGGSTHPMLLPGGVVEDKSDFFWRSGNDNGDDGDDDVAPEPKAAPGGPSSATSPPPAQGLYNTPFPYHPPSLLHPTLPPGGSTMPPGHPPGGSTMSPAGRLADDQTKLDSGGGPRDTHEDTQIKTGRGDFSNISTNDGIDDDGGSASTPWPTQPRKAPRHLNISALIDMRNILPADARRARQRTEKKTFTLIVLHNPHILLVVARTFAAQLAGAPSATYLKLPPEPTTLKQAQRHVYAKDWLYTKGDEY